MKELFKYSFADGSLSARGIAFAITAGMMFIFIVLGSLGLLPTAALITAVSLGGCGLAAVIVVNIISDVSIGGRMFTPPKAYLYTLAPVHRGKMLFASVITMMVLDIVTMTVVIFGQVWLSMMLAGESVFQTVVNAIGSAADSRLNILWGISMAISGYLLIMMIIMFCSTARKTFLYTKPAAGFLEALLTVACILGINVLTLILAPFGTVSIYGVFISISIGGPVLFLYALILLLAAIGLFIPTAKLMERKMNY